MPIMKTSKYCLLTNLDWLPIIPENKIKNRNKYIIVCGDFNLLNHQNDERVGEFLNIMYSHFLQPFTTEPTKMIVGQRPSIVDKIFTNIFEKNLNSSNLIDKITDHLQKNQK